MTENTNQFTHQSFNNHFEKDTHIALQNLSIERIHMLYGETSEEDITVVIYKGSPYLSIYNSIGRLIDVDHYLPDNFTSHDVKAINSVIGNLKNYNSEAFDSTNQYAVLIEEIFDDGNDDLLFGLMKKYGLRITGDSINLFLSSIEYTSVSGKLSSFLKKNYNSLRSFLEALLKVHQKNVNGYVHITAQGNIVITPINKRSGLSVILETQSTEGILLRPEQWIITRTDSASKLAQALVFRMEDIKAFFDSDGYEDHLETDRYRLHQRASSIAMDSLVDQTDNLLELNTVNDCYQILASDNNIVIALTKPNQITVVNTHLSIIPRKWPKTLTLPYDVEWIRVDENLNIIFVQKKDLSIRALKIDENQASEVGQLGQYQLRFEVDQHGSVIAKSIESGDLIYIRTNATDLELSSQQQGVHSVVRSLSHLIKGESLFTKTQFAKEVSEKEETAKSKLPTAIEEAKYDFETNIDHMLVQSDNSYEKLLELRNKIAIARQNISDELSEKAEAEGIILVGQRLKTIINNIVKPTDLKLRNLIETMRADVILAATKKHLTDVKDLSNPGAYREVLNSIRQYETELLGMLDTNSGGVLTEFKIIQQELNTNFSDQIAKDGSTLQDFISGEIEQIETAIKETHEPRQLEILMSTHPAAIELMTLLKQPFVLQNIARESNLSPAGIQSRLFKAVENRRKELTAETERKNAEKHAAKMQLADMIRDHIHEFVGNHIGSFAEVALAKNANHQQILSDIGKLENQFKDVRLSMELRRLLERRILERNRADLEKMITFEGKYAYIQNDPDLYIDMNSTLASFPTWSMDLIEKKAEGLYGIIFNRNTDNQVYRPSTAENLDAEKAFEITETDYPVFADQYRHYTKDEYSYDFIAALWKVYKKEASVAEFPQFSKATLQENLPKDKARIKALRCALEKKHRDHEERYRKRDVPVITPEFIDETPYFQMKLNEFIIKAKLQLTSGSGIILLSGPPSTGKSAFLKFISAIMNREYFEHASDKWQTKNSLVTAIKFGEQGPYTIPAGFTKAITTPYSLVNIEEIKEWPEALRKSLNPFFAGSKVFIAPDGTKYDIGDNILLCAAANLGSMYRQDDEPFTADFWSRIEVVEYDYAPMDVDRSYYDQLHFPKKHGLLTMSDLIKSYFKLDLAPEDPVAKVTYLAQRFIEFTLLPKADEQIKRDNIQNHIRDYFKIIVPEEANLIFSPEEAAKVALRRMKTLQQYSPIQFYDLYDHFVNGHALQTASLINLQSNDVDRYEHLRVITLSLRYLEGCLRHLRGIFQSTAGQTEIEGTNREFIKCVYLLGMV